MEKHDIEARLRVIENKQSSQEKRVEDISLDAHTSVQYLENRMNELIVLLNTRTAQLCKILGGIILIAIFYLVLNAIASVDFFGG